MAVGWLCLMFPIGCQASYLFTKQDIGENGHIKGEKGKLKGKKKEGKTNLDKAIGMEKFHFDNI